MGFLVQKRVDLLEGFVLCSNQSSLRDYIFSFEEMDSILESTQLESTKEHSGSFLSCTVLDATHSAMGRNPRSLDRGYMFYFFPSGQGCEESKFRALLFWYAETIGESLEQHRIWVHYDTMRYELRRKGG